MAMRTPAPVVTFQGPGLAVEPKPPTWRTAPSLRAVIEGVRSAGKGDAGGANDDGLRGNDAVFRHELYVGVGGRARRGWSRLPA